MDGPPLPGARHPIVDARLKRRRGMKSIIGPDFRSLLFRRLNELSTGHLFFPYMGLLKARFKLHPMILEKLPQHHIP